MPVTVRTWNVFHGNTSPPGRRSRLEEMIRLVSADGPDVVCLQEVPVWAIARLAGWSGMQVFASVARSPRLPTPLSARVTRVHNGVIRSLVAGQGNAMLVHARHEARALGAATISAWGREPRRVHAVAVGELVVGNTHLSSPADTGVQLVELERCVAFLDRFAPGAAVVLAGDLNLRDPAMPGFEGGGSGIDHILVRGLELLDHDAWPETRRRLGPSLLSDHPLVEATIK